MATARLYPREGTYWLDLREEGQPRRRKSLKTSDPKLAQRVLRRERARLGKQSGIPHHVHPHSFRHGHAMALLKSGVEAEIVRAQLRHRSLESLARNETAG